MGIVAFMQLLRRMFRLRNDARSGKPPNKPAPPNQERAPSEAAGLDAVKQETLERAITRMVNKRQVEGLASLASTLLRRAPSRADMVRQAADVVARFGRSDEAAQILADLLAAAPAAVSGRLISTVLSSGEHPLLGRLHEHASNGKLSDEAMVAVIQALERANQIGAAMDLARLALERSPHNVDLHIELANFLRTTNDLDGARRTLESARKLAPTDHRILRHLGLVESRMDNYEAAEVFLRGAVAANPQNLRNHLDLARCLLNQKRFADAAQGLRDAITAFPDRAEGYALLGHVLRWCGEHREALVHLARAIELEPNNSLAMVETAQIREEIGEFEPALDLHRRAAEARKDPSYNATIFCHALLAAGRGRDAWATNMNRVECRALRTLPGVRMWEGEPLAGKSIMVINEGGTGDQIRDACTYAELIAAADRVTVVCEPRLMPLFQRSFPQASFLGVKPERRVAEYERMLSKLIDDPALAEMKQHDYCVLSPELLYYFRGDDELWGKRDSYLVPAPELLDRWRDRIAALGPDFKIGISWRSGALYYNRECFYTQLNDWRPILTLPGVQFVNVQYDESEAEVRAAEDAFGIRIHRWDDLNLKDDFDGVSALLRQLDLVLAPNTTVLELAGALGVPGRYMIRVPIAYDHWRRKGGTDQDRIYPSVRQIRGERPWDPHSLIANTAAMIQDEIRKKADLSR